MERKQLKEIFERMERKSIDVLELLDFLYNICDSEIIEDNCQYLYIIVKILKKKCDTLDTIRAELQIACLD